METATAAGSGSALSSVIDEISFTFDAWQQSGERVRAQARRRMLVVIGAFLLAVGVFTWTFAWDVNDRFRPQVAAASGLFVLLGLACSVGGWFQYQEAKADYRLRAQRARLDAAVEGLKTSMELPDLLRLNQRQIDAYHDLTKAQAAHSYRNSQLAMSIGFVVLVAGSVVAISTHDDTSKVVVGALASLGAGISGYVGATFMRAHNESLSQLNFYFRQPLVNSYLLTAERLASKVQDSTEMYQKTYCLMIEHVMSNAFGLPGAPAQPVKVPPVDEEVHLPPVAAANGVS